MVHQREDLGLSLSLSFPADKNNNNSIHSESANSSSSTLQLNLMSSLPSSAPSPFNFLPNYNFSSSLDQNLEACRVETRSFLEGIDVNRLPSTVDMEEEAGVSSPNSTLSSVSGKRGHERSELGNADDLIDCSRGTNSDEEDGDNGRKKLRLSKDQSAILEESFKEHNTLNPKQKLALAKRLGLRPRQVEVWFQNRRARTKLKQTEVDCEFLKRCYENLTEENRRLQKEVQELRALKLSPKFYMQMTPPTTLTMCPSCERVAAPPSAAPAGPSATTTIDQPPRPHQMVPNNHHHRLPFNPWASTSVAHRPFDALHPRS